ncbi:hypothetical protein BD410DRAFT_813305 [Rickenella mellea]|uniref:Pyridoxal phosphate homeostasis protein n=1 Tax=Rickenella mellea TaxID=50990 RepID=A0A4Y7QEK2_9AGAM|nr:hypothetical protein BD410DRAFT_813305 [Rickenella mellea]
MSTSAYLPPFPPADHQRAADLADSLTDIQKRVQTACGGAKTPTLVAVSKLKPVSDILACYEAGQRDFGENYVQELVDKAAQLPSDIRWHFIGTLQSNKAKLLASISNLYAIQTLTSVKTADALNRTLAPPPRLPLAVFLQVNTSLEDTKSGVAPLNVSSPPTLVASSNGKTMLHDAHAANRISELYTLAAHIVTQCPRLRLQGLMTIGALDASLAAASGDENADFIRLRETRDALESLLLEGGDGQRTWGNDAANESGPHLELSMGMSSDFEAALMAGSDVVRVGTGIFGARPTMVET